MSPVPPEDAHVPANWDRLRLDDDDSGAEELLLPPPSETAPPRMTLVAAAWGDLVAVVAVLTAALVAVLLGGRPVTVAALPWTCALALAWWLASACVLLVVRRATPGMLMAGIALRSPPMSHRMPWTLLVALLTAASGGLLALPGGRRTVLARVSGSDLVVAAIEGGELE